MKRILSICMIVFAATVALSPSAAADVVRTQPITGKLDYAELTELPEETHNAVVAHLERRLGAEFLQHVVFIGGNIVDTDSLIFLPPYRRTIDLFFALSAPDKGITRYETFLRIDQDGKVIREIELPHVALTPSKAALIAYDDAYQRALPFEVTDNGAMHSIEYCKSRDSLCFKFPVTDSRNIVYVDAHDGTVFVEGGKNFNHAIR